MQKIVTFKDNDVCADPEAVCRMLLDACHQPSGTYRVRGLCQAGDNVYALLLPVPPDGMAKAYRFIEIQDETPAAVTSLLAERWAAGFDGIGSVNFPDGLTLFFFAETSA